MDAKLTPTVEDVARELGTAVVPVRQIVEAILARHRRDYPSGVEVEWPPKPRLETVEGWLTQARDLLTTNAHHELHGRAVILALALADPPSGRAIVRAGLFLALLEQLRGRFIDGLTPAGLERLEEIPLVGAMEGVAMGAITLAAGIEDIAFSPSGQMIAVGHRVGWTVVTKYRRRVLRTAELHGVTTIGFSRDGRDVIAGVDDKFLRFPLRGGEADLVGAEVSPLAIRAGIAVGDDRVYVDREPAEPFHGIVAAAIARDARVVAGADLDGLVRVWSPDHGELGLIQIGDGPVSVALSPDGTRLATRGTHQVAVWDVASGRHEWGAAVDGPGTLAFNGTHAAAPGRSHTEIFGPGWDASSGAVPGNYAAFSHDGSLLAIGGIDATVTIVDPERARRIAVLRHTAPVTDMAWSPEGHQLVTGTGTGTLAAWAGGLEPPPRRRLAAYSADDTRAADDLAQRLPIDPDVDALAALLAATAVDPPLSVGLFGHWGSGKTFFMRRLKRRIAELASDARDSGELQRDVAWHKRIVQIEFNAWHYADGNLWASLVAHILDNLRLSEDEDEDLVERRRSAVLAQITAQTVVTQEARDAAEQSRSELSELERDLVELEQEDALATASPLRPVVEAVVGTAGAVLTAHDHRAAATFAELDDALTETRATLTRGSEVFTPLVAAPRRGWRVAALVAILALVPVVAWAVSELAPAIDETLTGIVALLGGAAAWLQRQAAWTRARLDDVQRAADELARPARELRAERRREIARKQREHEAAARRAQEENQRLAALETELTQTTASRLLAQLIAERVDSDDYRRHLGLLALVRRDFQAMSDYLRLQAEDLKHYQTLEEEEADDDVRIGRIVLYIDDLDRCEPPQVVAVLQAVHLLLAFPLFTVVVGVDVRWVERALRLHHTDLLGTEGGADPRDYLEKIFQIPFWLEPLDSDASKAMLRTMLGSRELKRGLTPFSVPAHGPEPETAPAASPTEAARHPDVPVSSAPLVAPPRDLRPESLEVTEDELQAMDALAPLLGRSPRALKRFLNTYRLIKVRAGDPVAFVREDAPVAPYRAVSMLLAIATGLPHEGARLIDAILAGRDATYPPQIPWQSVPPEALRPYAEEVVRFTFHWHQSMYS